MRHKRHSDLPKSTLAIIREETLLFAPRPPAVSVYKEYIWDNDPNVSRTMPHTDEQYIFTTVRYDPALLYSAENTKASFGKASPYYMLEHHWRRLQEAADSDYPPVYAFYEPQVFAERLHKAVRDFTGTSKLSQQALRINFRVDRKGETAVHIMHAVTVARKDLFPLTLRHDLRPDERPYTVFVDDQPTAPGEATWHKTSDRTMYNRARQGACIEAFADPEEVLLYNRESEIMDASITTPYLFRNGRWVTPARVCGGQEGTTRRWALANGLCESGVVLKPSLREGELIWLSNGLRGFIPGRVKLRQDAIQGWKPVTPVSRSP